MATMAAGTCGEGEAGLLQPAVLRAVGGRGEGRDQAEPGVRRHPHPALRVQLGSARRHGGRRRRPRARRRPERRQRRQVHQGRDRATHRAPLRRPRTRRPLRALCQERRRAPPESEDQVPCHRRFTQGIN